MAQQLNMIVLLELACVELGIALFAVYTLYNKYYYHHYSNDSCIKCSTSK